MSEKDKFTAYKMKLENTCEENNLTFRLRCDHYPITLSIRPLQGVGEQLAMMEMEDNKTHISPDAYLLFYYSNGDLRWKSERTFNIDDALFGKLKNLYKHLHFTFLQYFHRYVCRERLLDMSKLPIGGVGDALPDPEAEDISEDFDPPEDEEDEEAEEETEE